LLENFIGGHHFILREINSANDIANRFAKEAFNLSEKRIFIEKNPHRVAHVNSVE
jgi:hypothetical protein